LSAIEKLEERTKDVHSIDDFLNSSAKILLYEEKLVPSLGNFYCLGRAQKFSLIIAVSRILNKRKISLHRQKSLV